MGKRAESLRDYVRRIFRERTELSLQVVARRSGGGISAGYVNDIIQGNATNPSVDKLQALARGLGVSEDEVFAIARGKLLNDQQRMTGICEALYSRVNELSEGDVQWFTDVMEMLNRELTLRIEKRSTER